MLSCLLALVAVVPTLSAQFVQSDSHSRNLTVVRLPGDSNVTISYKDPGSTCKTASEKQRQLTAWVSVPAEYPANMFLWFIEARKPTQNLTIWLNGGPGSSSLVGMFDELGPCEVVEKGLDRYDTVAREWGWDRASNLLFIDQPLHVGFSYDVPTNATQDLAEGSIYSPPSSAAAAVASRFLRNGTFSSNDPRRMLVAPKDASMAIWHTLQAFLGAFPQYRTSLDGHTALNVFAQSYASMYAPVLAEVLEDQNAKRSSGVLNPNTTLQLQLSSLGLVNGRVDMMIQTPFHPIFAHNNTYGIQRLSEAEAQRSLERFDSHGGCRDLLVRCQSNLHEPEGPGTGHAIGACLQATESCTAVGEEYYQNGGNPYDITSPRYHAKVPLFFAEYLNQAQALQAIGSPVNFTIFSNAANEIFFLQGEPAQGGRIKQLASLLRKGIQVALIYGDTDYNGNWFGGEAISLAIAQHTDSEYASKFPSAEYSPILVNEALTGGQVRQYGNLSFSRIYQAGHLPGIDQPETMFRVFSRLIGKRPVSGGTSCVGQSNCTDAPRISAGHSKLVARPKSHCFLRNFYESCDEKMQILAATGGVDVYNGVLTEKPRC